MSKNKIISNPDYKVGFNKNKEALFSVIPSINNLSYDNYSMKNVINAYTEEFVSNDSILPQDVESAIICARKTICICRRDAENSISYLKSKLKKYNEDERYSLESFINNLENRLDCVIDDFALNLFNLEINSIFCEIYIYTLNYIMQTFVDTAHGISKKMNIQDDEVGAVVIGYFRAVEYIRELIDAITKNASLITPFIHKPYTYVSIQPTENSARQLGKTVEDTINTNVNASLSIAELYYRIRLILSSAFADVQLSDDIPYYLLVLSQLDGSGIFHMMHEKIITTKQYADSIFELYKKNDIISDSSWDFYIH